MMTTRKLIIGKKVVGGLPKEKPISRRRGKVLLNPHGTQEWLTITVYGHYTDDPKFANLEDEIVVASASIKVETRIEPEKASWHRVDGPKEIVLYPSRRLLATRVECELPAALRSYRPGRRQNLPIQSARILPGNTLTIVVPDSLIDFK